ncbi:hypothetical protein D3C87_1908740 [compost metagenome]
MLGQEPHAVGQVREVDLAVVEELHVVRVFPFLADTIVVVTQETAFNHFFGGIHIGFACDQFGDFRAVFGRFDVTTGFQDGFGHS